MSQGNPHDERIAEQAHAWTLARLLFVGASTLLEVRREFGGGASFDRWRDALLRAVPELNRTLPDADGYRQSAAVPTVPHDGTGIRPAHLTWLWDALTREPYLQSTTRFDPLAPVPVLPRGSMLRFELNNTFPLEVVATLLEPLGMTQGKLGRFELMPADVVLLVPAENSRVGATSANDEEARRAAEARLLGVRDHQVLEIAPPWTMVHVQSVNQAYTVASVRREPDRASHTGSVYQRVACEYDEDLGEHLPYENQSSRDGSPLKLLRLRHIRDRAEAGTWTYQNLKDAAYLQHRPPGRAGCRIDPASDEKAASLISRLIEHRNRQFERPPQGF